MAALTADRQTPHKGEGKVQELPVAASTVIYKGSIVSINSSGYAIPGADTASTIVAGIATKGADNSSGSNGDVKVDVLYEVRVKLAGQTLAQADLGAPLFVVDDQTVDASATTNNIPCGRLAEFVGASEGWVDLRFGGAA